MIKIGVKAKHVWHDHPLTVSIFIGDNQIFSDDSGKDIDFTSDIELEDGQHEFRLVVSNKTFANVVQEEDVTTKDSYILIDSIMMDDVDLDQILNPEAKFYPDHPSPKAPVLEKIKELGYNGEYRFTFTAPVYEWLIEKLF